MKLTQYVGKVVTVNRERTRVDTWSIQIEGRLRRFACGYAVEGFVFPEGMVKGAETLRLGRYACHSITLR